MSGTIVIGADGTVAAGSKLTVDLRTLTSDQEMRDGHRGRVAGRADTEFTFATFEIPKPQLARLMSVNDEIELEVELKLEQPAAQTEVGAR